jgi:hypothetical protein
MWSSTAQKRKGNPERASFMQNARVAPGIVGSRSGSSALNIAVAGPVTGLFNWIQPGTETLVAQFSGQVNVANGSLIQTVDNPHIQSFVFSAQPTNFAGWAIAGSVNTVTQVALSIDGIPIGNATYGFPRPDVAAQHPGQAGSPNLGWNDLIDLSAYPTGGHLLDVTVTDSAGNTVSTQVSFFVNRPPTAERNLVLYQDGASIDCYDQAAQSITTLLPGSTGIRPSFADLDVWTYVCAYDNTGLGQFQVRIFDGTNVDIAFRTTIYPAGASASDAGTGYCTLGTHFVGFVYQNRNGFSGPPAAVNSSQGTISVMLTADNRQINVSVPWPACPDGGGNSQLFLIMTLADSPNNWYFVPTDQISGSIGALPVPNNSAVTLNFVANISDGDLAASADSAQDYFRYLAQDINGNGPFSPNFVGVYGQRMFYGVGTTLYVSEVNAPQQVTLDQHSVTTPNKRKLGYAFPLAGTTDLYLTGDRWTSRVTDNGDVPATWAQPVKISDSLGAPFPSCVCFRTRGGYAWIVTEAGIYVFDGNYGDRPATYLVSDQWERVNWTAAYTIETADDVVNRRFYAAVPLDKATQPTHQFCLDYTNGLEFDQVDISLDIYAQPFSSIGIVKETATGEDMSNLWIGPSAAGKIAHLDPTTHNDQGLAIDSFWESGLVRGVSDFNSRMIRVGALDLWIRGNGSLLTTVYGPDKVQSVTPQLLTASGVPATLAAEPGIMYQQKFDLTHVENYTVRVETNAVDAWWELSEVVGYAKQDLFNR